jgi:hypothetical protein
MKVRHEAYSLTEEIPVLAYLKKRKLVKYFGREISAAMVCLAHLLAGATLPGKTPFYFARSHKEYEDFDLQTLADACRDESGKFSQHQFINRGIASMSPLIQFKILYNMPLSFIALEYQLTGDNAVLYSSAAGLMLQALHGPGDLPLLLGAGRMYGDGHVEVGFALASKVELAQLSFPAADVDAIDMFRAWAQRKNQ